MHTAYRIIFCTIICIAAGPGWSAEDGDSLSYPASKQTDQRRLCGCAGLIYGPSGNIRDEYIFPGYHGDISVIWGKIWNPASIGYGLKAGISTLRFEHGYAFPSLMIWDAEVLFLVSWGRLYRMKIMFQPHAGIAYVKGKNIDDKTCWTYGGRLHFKLPSSEKITLFVDGKMVNTTHLRAPFGGTLALVQLGIGYIF